MKGIASGIVASFCSRNNDVDGYWTLGVLYRLSVEAGTHLFELDLLSGVSSPAVPFSARWAAPYARYLAQQVRRKGLEACQVTGAIVSVTFCVPPTERQIIFRGTWGDPFVCRVVITDDLGKEHSQEYRGWCGIHDPKREHRSTRQYLP